MDNKKLGIIGLVLVGIYLVLSILDANDALTFLPERFNISSIYSSLLLIAAGCWILSNDEHMILAYADFAIAILYIIYSFGISLIPYETYVELIKVLVYISSAFTVFMIINIPLLIRTQSQAHRAIKYVTVLFIILLVLLVITSKDSSSSLSISGMTSSYSSSKSKLLEYGIYLVEALLIANPMVAIATSDGLGGAGKSRMPKLVARNQATDPNMAHQNTIQTGGINYGGMPVPDGVVANQNFNAIPNDNLNASISPEILNPTPVETVETLDTSVPISTSVPTEQAPALETAQPALATPSPTNTINSDDVAAELQSLTNNNQ